MRENKHYVQIIETEKQEAFQISTRTFYKANTKKEIKHL